MAKIVLPGDVVQIADSDTIIGCGFDHRKIKNNGLLVVQPGIKKMRDGKLWVSVHSRRYIPQNGDNVIGVVSSSHGDTLKVDIGSADLATLDYFSFEGATKSNRPNITTGDVIFANVLHASKHLEPELTCVDEERRSRGLGLLPRSGFMFRCNLNLIRRLLSPNSQLLTLLGNDIKYEITCGMNGRIWINGSKRNEISAIYRIIMESENIPEPDIPKFVENKLRLLRGFPSDN